MSGVFTIGKQATLYASPFFLTGIRITTGGLYFLVYQYLTDHKKFYLKKSWIPLLICYSICVFIMDSFRLIGLKYIASSHGALIATTAPFFAAFFSWIVFKESLNIKKLFALLLGFAGVVPLLLSYNNSIEFSFKEIASYTLILFSTMAFVIGGISSKLLSQKGMPFFMLVGSVMTGGGILGFIASLFSESWYPFPVSHYEQAVKIIIYLIITQSLIAYPLYNYLLTVYPITLVAFAQLIVPFFTAILGTIMFNETVGYQFIISFVVLSFSLTLFYYEVKEGLIKNN
jgi:drug/metabolite transporter (DMT)-like permease